MTQPLIVLACVLRTIEFGPPPDARCHTPQVLELVSAFQKYGSQYDVPAHIEAAKCYHESGFNKHARGTHGEIGICQPKPHGAIQGRDLKLTRAQVENIDTNIRISTQYIAQFVRQCEHPSGWLTKYNRPARGCRTSIYSAGVLTDLRRAREEGLRLAQSEGSPSADPSNPSLGSASWSAGTSRPLSAGESGSTWAEQLPLDRISRTGEGSDPSTSPDTDRRRPSGTRRATPTEQRPAPSEAELAAPFQEPR